MAHTTKDFRWDGPTVKRKRNGDTYYYSFIMEEERYSIGDFAFLWSGNGEPTSLENCFIAKIDNMWEDCCGVSWIEIMWYYRPEELHCGRLTEHLPNEIFESNLSDENETSAVCGKCIVLSPEEFDKLPASERKRKGVFVCRFHYDPNKHNFMPVLGQTSGATTKAVKRRLVRTSDRLLAFSGPAPTPGRAGAGVGVRGGANTEEDGSDGGEAGLEEEEGEGGLGAGAGDEDLPACKFARAARVLQLSAVPASLPGRTAEKDAIKSAVQQALQGAGSAGGG